ncbi:MAG: Pentalenene synthase [Flavipsychrobacter sp.]|nr:Pentalenene synthase [Flavipsychrobacter sp.]
MHNTGNTIDLIKSILSSGPRGLGTKNTNIAALLNRPAQESDTELRHRPPYRDDAALGEELNERILVWAERLGLYGGHLDYLKKCNFGRYVMLTYAFAEDRERLFLACQANVSLFGVDDYFVDDKRVGVTSEMVGRNLAFCMSAVDEPYLTPRYNEDTIKGLNAHPVLASLREYIANAEKLGTPQQVGRLRHEDMTLFMGMCQEASWRMNKMIAPTWEYLGGRQMNSLLTCIAMIDIVEAYELPANIYYLPKVRLVTKVASLITVMVNDLVSSKKEEEAGLMQFGIREAIQKEEGCSFEEAHRLGVRLHNDLLRIFEDESAKLMVYATPELRRYLIGLDAWIAGSHRWHFTSDRYSGK